MNQRLYRIVFNRALGVLQVVAEIARRCVGGGATASSGRAQEVTVPALRFAVWCALGFVTAIPALAQVVADPNAPGHQRPTVLPSASGAPLINITTPSAAGVSRNIYRQFDVGADGAILNNSRNGAQTQLGGGIAGNPWLATGTAKVILNEVNSANPAHLRGFVEVGGDRAQVVIASPAGITCDGCGVLNATRLTLTTGTPVLNGGALDYYRVHGGVIRVEGAGLDATHTDFTDLISRSLVANGKVWANQLQATLGANTVKADHSQVTAAATATEAPTFALDTGALGGMYAGKVTLLGTEHGVGVRHAGHIGASAGELVVTIDGRLESTGTLQSTTDTRIDARGGVANAGTISAGRELSVTTAGDMDNSGGELNARRIEVEAQSLRNRGGSIEQTGGQTLALQAGTVSNRDGGRLGLPATAQGGTGSGTGGGDVAPVPPPSQGGDVPPPVTDSGGGGDNLPQLPPQVPAALADGALRLAGALDNDGGSINAGGGLDLDVHDGLDNSGGHLGLRELTMTRGDLGNAGGELRVAGDARLDVGRIGNDAGRWEVAGALVLTAQEFSNRGGRLSHSGIDATRVTVAGTLDNRDGELSSGASALTIDSGVLVNERGRIEHAGAAAMTVRTGALHGRDGAMVTAGAASLAAGTVDHRGATLAATQTTVTADAFDNRGGRITANGSDANRLTSGTLDNSDGGRIESNGDLHLRAATLGNAGGTIQHAGTGALHIDATTLNGAGGTIESNGGLTLTGQTTDLRDGTTSAQRVTIDTGRLTTAGGRLTATSTDALALTVRDTLDNRAGLIQGNGALAVAAGALDNGGGTIAAAGDAASQITVTGALDNRAGTIAAGGSTTVTAGDLDNRAGALQAMGGLQVTVDGTLDNSGQGHIAAAGDMALAAEVLDNTSGAIEHAGDGELAITAETLEGAAGSIVSNGALTLTGERTNLRDATTAAQRITIDTGELTTAGGTLTAAGDDPLALSVRGTLDNNAGAIRSNGGLQLRAAALTNAAGTISSAGTAAADITMAGRLDNSGGTIATAGATTVRAGDLINQGGRVQAAGDTALQVTVDGQLVNDAGTIEGNGDIALAAGALSNLGGVVQTQGAIAADVTGALDNSGGTVAAGGDLRVQADTVLNRDTFDAAVTDPALQKGLFGRQVTLDAATIDNTLGQIVASDALALTGTTVGNAGGRIDGTGNVRVAAGTLDNAGGELFQRGAGGALVVNVVGGLDNTAGGLIGAEGTADIDAGAIDNSGGTVFARGDMRLTPQGDLHNRAGKVQSNGALTVSADGLFDNTDGTVDGSGSVGLSAARIDNVRGAVLAGGTSDGTALTVTTTTLHNGGGTLASRSGDVTLDVDNIDNRDGGRLVASRDLLFQTAALNNAGGTVYATRHLSYENAAGTLDNIGGQFGAGDTTRLTLAQIGNGNGGRIQSGTLWLSLPTLDTTGGEIAANVLHAQLATLTGGGRLYGAHWLDVAFSGDFTYDNGLRMESDGKLDLSVAGTFTNRGTLETAAELAITAIDVINQGTINASNAAGTGKSTITASGTIDNQTGASLEGDLLALTARDVANTGDIVGDVVTIDADTLTNGHDLGTAQVARDYGEGFIGAAEYLELRIGQSLRNLDAEIFSAGDMSITGRGGDGTRVAELNNISGRIQAEGDAHIGADTIRNERRVLDFIQRALTPAEQAAMALESSGSDALTYSEGIGEVNDRLCGMAGNPCTHFRVDQYIERATPIEGLFVDTSTVTAGSQLQAGGNLTLDTASLRNRYSAIAAGYDLTINGSAQSGSSGESAAGVINESLSGQQTYQITAEYAVGYQTCPTNVPYTCDFEDFGDYGTLDFGTVTRVIYPDEGRATITAGNALSITTGGDVSNSVVSAAGGMGGIDSGALAVASASGMAGARSTQVNATDGLQLALTEAVNGAANPDNAAAQVVGTPDRPLPGLVPPDNGMFDTTADPNAPFLVTTAPRFAAKGSWTSSDYLFRAMGYDPTRMQKRVGDGYYEQRLVLDQLLQLTGRRTLTGTGDGLEQYRSLMDGAMAQASRLGLALGAPLSSLQIEALEQDIVWLVEQEVGGQKVLVPVVYLSKATAERLRADGAMMAGNTVDIHSEGTVTNSGAITGDRGTWLNADALINDGAISGGEGWLDVRTRGDTINRGAMTGRAVAIDAGGDVVNAPALEGLAWRGGVIGAGDGGMQISAGRDVVNQGQIVSGGHALVSAGRDFIQNAATAAGGTKAAAGQVVSAGSTVVSAGRDAVLEQSGIYAGEHAVIDAGRDAVFTAAEVKVGGSLAITAGRDIVSEVVTDTVTHTAKGMKGKAHATTTTVNETVTGSTFEAVGDIAMVAGRDITLKAAEVYSDEGSIALSAKRDVNLLAAQETDTMVQDTTAKKKGMLSSTRTTTHTDTSQTIAHGTSLSGESVTVVAGRDITTEGAQVVATDDVALAAGRNLTIGTAETEYRESFTQTQKKSGVYANGGFNVTAGKSQVDQGNTYAEHGHQGSVIGSANGKVSLAAGNAVHITGSDVLSSTGTDIIGKSVTIDAAVNRTEVTQSYKEKSAGVHLGLTGGVVSAAEAAYGAGKAAGQVQDDRLKAVYATQAAMAAKDAYDGAMAMADGASASDAGISLRVGIGASSASAQSKTVTESSQGSRITSGGGINIVATDGDLNVIGSAVDGKTVALAAAGDIRLKSQEEHHSSESKNKNGSGEVGMSFGSTTGVYVSANAGKGKGNGSGVTHAETTIKGRDGVAFVSGGNTTLEGAQIIADKVVGSVGGNLTIISEQDRDDYNSKQQQAGGTFVYGSGGSVNYGKQGMDSSYASVKEQSGIQAGGGGFQIDVKGHTQLDGGAIASGADPSDNRFATGSLGHSDIKNAADYKADSIGVGVGTSGGNVGLAPAQSDDSEGFTKAGIANGVLIVGDGGGTDIARGTTGLQQDGLTPIFNEQEVRENQKFASALGETAIAIVDRIYDAKLGGKQQQIDAVKAAADDASANGDSELAGQLYEQVAYMRTERDADNGAFFAKTLVGLGVSAVAGDVSLESGLTHTAINAGISYWDEAANKAARGHDETSAMRISCNVSAQECADLYRNMPSPDDSTTAERLQYLRDNGMSVEFIGQIPEGAKNIAVNGILNDEARAGHVQIGHVSGDAGAANGISYYVQYNASKGALSDLQQSGYDKMISPFNGDYSATTIALVEAAARQGDNEVNLFAHSWGSIVTRNALSLLADSDYKNKNMNVDAFGAAVRPGSLVKSMIAITGEQRVFPTDGTRGSLGYFTSPHDPVSTFVGGTLLGSKYLDSNSKHHLPGAAQGGFWGALKGIKPVFDGAVNPHSCYGLNCAGTSYNWTEQKAAEYKRNPAASMTEGGR